MIQTIKKLSFYAVACFCNRDYKRMVTKSRSSITKELDLRKFLIRQRISMVALMGLLKGRQSFFVDKMSQLIIRESSNMEETSEDTQLSDWEQDGMNYTKRMVESGNQVDQRLIKLYKVRVASQRGIHLGFSKEITHQSLLPKKSITSLISPNMLAKTIIINRPSDGLPLEIK
mmetsp:Transcript_34452/g.42513  ORF Transcript_34452/g.42513 Transcript_34452/m.42513 type:complete len:173 (+) Transcript_34452:541-1059(+)